MKRTVRSLRRRLWTSLVGCSCPPLAEKDERCTPSAVRCQGRIDRINRDYAKHGLAVGIGSADSDGLDPDAPPSAVRRRERAIEALKEAARR